MVYLQTIKQRDAENLKAYLSRFNLKCMTTDDQEEKVTLAALLWGIWPHNSFMAKSARKMPTTLREFMDCMDSFINMEVTSVSDIQEDRNRGG